MRRRFSYYALIIVAFVATFVAAAHLSCLYLGEECYRYQLAPAPIIESAMNGTFFAPVATVLASLAFLLAAGYALSSAGVFGKWPLLNVAMYSMAVVFIFRGAIVFVDLFIAPHFVTNVNVFISATWLASGLVFAFCHRAVRGIET